MSGPHPTWPETLFVAAVLCFPFLVVAGFMVLAAVLIKWVIS